MQITEEPGVQYFEGKYSSWKLTKFGHILITLEDPYLLYPNLGKPMRIQSRFNPMNFIVPKRRQRIFDLAKRLPLGKKLTLKLIQERLSKKHTVSLIHFERG